MRSDSYFSTLPPAQRDAVRALALDASLSLREFREQAPAWPATKRKPSTVALSRLRKALRAEDTLTNIKATAAIMEKVHKQLAGQADDMLLDSVLSLVGQEVLQQTLEKDSLDTRNHTLRLLLKARDQEQAERKIALLEQKAAKSDQAESTVNDRNLSEEEKARRIRAIFGR